MDKGSAIVEQNRRSSRVSSKRKRTVSSGEETPADNLPNNSGAAGESSSSASVDTFAGAASAVGKASSPKAKRARKTAKSSSTTNAFIDESAQQQQQQEAVAAPKTVTIKSELPAEIVGTNSTNNVGDKSRGLVDLVDYFPSFELGRRLTRSLARQIGAAPESVASRSQTSSSSATVEGSSSSKKRRTSLSVASSAVRSPSISGGAQHSAAALSQSPPNDSNSASSSNLAVKTGCHLSRKTHPSVGTTSSSGSGRNSSKVGNSSGGSGGNCGSSSSDAGKSKDLGSSTGSAMEQHQNHQKHGAGGYNVGGKKGSGRSTNSGHVPSTVPKHGSGGGDGGYRIATGANALIDLERDGVSSSSDSMDATSGVSSSTTGAAVGGSGGGGGASSHSATASGRLHTLLDARNLPMHIFGALAPRVQTLFTRCPSAANGNGGNGGASGGVSNSIGGGCGGGRFDPLIQGMQKTDDPSSQLQSLIELCNILVMSNEETLGPNFTVKDTIRCLIKLLQSEQSYDIMTHACRALTYLMEAAPRVTPAVTDSVPLLLDKLQRVECIDVAEQALAALDLLSRRHSKCILMAGGIGACLQYIDFFSLASQRSALQIVANCCLHMTSEDFHFLVDSLSALTQRLNSTDKKTVELVCVLFTRLVENYMHEPEKMRRLCDYGLLENVQQMIVASPPVLSSSILVSIIRMMHTLCRQCSELAVRLLRLNVVASIRFLLMGTASAANAADAELLARTPQELYELVLLISELLPPLPSDGHLFEVDNWLKACYYYFYQGNRCVYSSFAAASSNPPHNAAVGAEGGSGGSGSAAAGVEHAYWTWKDERGLWRAFAHVDNQLLEAAFQAREEEVTLNTFGQQYTIDLVNMIQINDDTGYSRPVQRKLASPFGSSRPIVPKPAVLPFPDPRLELSRTEPQLHEELVRCLLPILYDIYTSVGGPAVRHECLRSMLRMIHHSDGELLLRESLKKEAVSSLLAGMLNSKDVKTIIPALQLCTVLMDKLPDVFHVHFRREGVTHQLRRLAIEPVQFMPSLGGSSAVGSSSSASASVDGFFSGGAASSTASLGYGSAPPSSTSTFSGLSSIPPSFFDRTAGGGGGVRDAAAAADGVGLNAISSVDQFLSAVSGLPLLRPHRHDSQQHQHHPHPNIHQRQLGSTTTTTSSSSFEASASSSSQLQQKRAVLESGATGVGASAASNDLASMDSPTSTTSSSYYPPPPPASAGASAAPGATSSSGAVPKRQHHHYHSSSSSSTSGATTTTKTSSSGVVRANVKTRRAAAAAAATASATAPKHAAATAGTTTTSVQQRGGIGTRSGGRTRSGAAEASASNAQHQSSTAHIDGHHHHHHQQQYAAAVHSTASTTSSFFQNLPFPKWARGGGANSSSVATSSVNVLHRQSSAPSAKPPAQYLRQRSTQQHGAGDYVMQASAAALMASSSASSMSSSANSLSLNAEKCVNWVRDHAKMLMTKYFLDNNEGFGGGATKVDLVSSAAQHAANVLERLVTLADLLKRGKSEAIADLAAILSSPTNVSCFELLQSGLVSALTQFLVAGGDGVKDGKNDDNLRSFCKAFFGIECRTDLDEDGVPTVVIDYHHHRRAGDGNEAWLHPARLLLTKLNVCVGQLEQFPVKVHDITGAVSSAAGGGGAGGMIGYGAGGGASFAMAGGPGGAGGPPFGLIGHLSGMHGAPSSLRGLSALRFLHSQQIKCHLQRHPEEKRLKQWNRGPIKIDPLAQIVTIEKYLLAKGIGRRCNSSNEEVSGDDDESSDDDEDEEDSSALFLSDLSDGTHKLQILVNDKVLPYDMTIYQAVRQYGLRSSAYVVHSGDSFGASGGIGGHSSAGAAAFASEWIGPEVWIHTHLITYRLSPEAANSKQQTAAAANTTTATSSSAGVHQTGSGSSSSGGVQKTSSAGGRSKAGTTKSAAAGSGGDGSSSSSSKFSSASMGDFGELKEPANALTVYLTSQLPTATPAVDTVNAGQASSSFNAASASSGTSVHDPSLDCVILMRILFGISRYWWVLYKDAIVTNFQPLLSLTDFHNTKLSAKVTRQLQDPLTVVAGQLPNWVEQLTNTCPFLFPFEVRLSVFHVVALDRDRALQRLLDSSAESGGNGGGGASERITPRLERRKVIVSRDDLLKQSETVLGTMENSRAVLEIQYENEVGTGLGPTLEFYALVSRQFQRAELQLWRGLGEEGPPTPLKTAIIDKRENENNTNSPAAPPKVVVGVGGLFPSPLGRHVKSAVLDKVLGKFRLLGKFLGRSLLDGRILDLPLSSVFYKWLIKEEQTLSWADLAELDPVLHRSIEYIRRQQLKACAIGDRAKMEGARLAIEAMDLDFTVPGYASLELMKNGKDKLVTLDNLQQYLNLLLHWLVKAGVCRQMEAVRDCLNALIPLKHLRLFFPEELDQLFCGARSESDIWESSALLQAVRPDHGYNHDSPPVRWLVDILATRFDDERRRQFVQFITGSPRLPVGGLKNLNPPLTIVRKTDASGSNADAQLPSVMTCVNYLKLPEYSTIELMEQRLLTAITYGRYSFHLS